MILKQDVVFFFNRHSALSCQNVQKYDFLSPFSTSKDVLNFYKKKITKQYYFKTKFVGIHMFDNFYSKMTPNF